MLSLYTLTYNAPKQFAYWCMAFRSTYPAIFEGCAKFVINNSDDVRTQAAYQALFEHYGFEVIPTYSNTGICGGRFLAAHHFDQSEATFMVFFEDDMLMRKKSNKLCKAGFRTYHPQLFELCLEIMKQEQLSYLKLCFSEVYSLNSHNLVHRAFTDDSERQVALGVIEAPPFTTISHLNTINNLPYAVGIFHYLNWPIVFSKQGNRTVFLDNIAKFKHESLWMRAAFYAAKEGKLRTGCLLATPILHHRKYSYSPKDRIENEYGQKIRGVEICREMN
ncbi:MAG: hypothetical protein ACK4GN_14425 [Runella sp.]